MLLYTRVVRERVHGGVFYQFKDRACCPIPWSNANVFVLLCLTTFFDLTRDRQSTPDPQSPTKNAPFSFISSSHLENNRCFFLCSWPTTYKAVGGPRQERPWNHHQSCRRRRHHRRRTLYHYISINATESGHLGGTYRYTATISRYQHEPPWRRATARAPAWKAAWQPAWQAAGFLYKRLKRNYNRTLSGATCLDDWLAN